jgi:hypothetical protein
MGFTQSKKVTDAASLQKLKILISGGSGSGKSTTVAKFRNVFVLPTELQGIPAMQAANPDATIFHNEAGEPGVRSVADIAEFMGMLSDPKLLEFDAIALDGLTDLQNILVNHYGAKFPDKKDSLKKWGAVREKTEAILRKLRDLPLHVIVTTLDTEVDDEGTILHRPNVYGKSSGFPTALPKYFNLVGYAFKKRSTEGMLHSMMFSGPDRFVTKKLPCLDDIEPAEPQVWLHKFSGSEVDADAQERADKWAALSGEGNS